ncbi:Na(+)-translocating NADH-quinone reductase subunit E [Ferrimonas balearica]|nr:Na(+)-translocating NADH-quinone reductase subunit E [Ferrimonas balearica]
MELFLVLAIFLLAAGGLALGLAFGRDPVQTSCGGAAKCGRACEICPNRIAAMEEEA